MTPPIFGFACLLLLGSIAFGCSAEPGRGDASPKGDPSRATSVADLKALDLTDWVSIYDPDRASNGYNLDLYKRRIPILFDMNGRIVHAWPEARVKSRVRLLPNGSILGIALARSIIEYDWDGNTVWERQFKGQIPHHDVIRLANGNTVTILATRKKPTDDIIEFDPQGEIVWEWDAAEHLSFYWTDLKINKKDTTHINSVQELPPNRWFDQGDDRFRPGNLLISARNLDAVFVIDKETKKIVWTYDTELDQQHEAVMTGPGVTGHGSILIFNNGAKNKYVTRRSSIDEIDPGSGSRVWTYRADTFLSQTGGIEQMLPHGNILIASSLGRRIFEITREGELVWEWTPSFKPKRPNRYPFDFCPQLAGLNRPTPTRITPAPGYLYVDPPLYKFARPKGQRQITISGKQRKVLRKNSTCRSIVVPTEATLQVVFGLDGREARSAGLTEYEAEYRVTLRSLGSEQEVELLSGELGLGSRPWRRLVVELASFAHQPADLCLEATDFGLWRNPVISTPQDTKNNIDDDDLLGGLTDEELEVRREHLEALGYID